MKSFWLALQFFSRWPTPQYAEVSAQDMGRAMAWLPVIGLLIGAVLWSVSLLQAWLPSTLVALLILVLWVWQTGALHIDGVADFADAWLGGCGNQQRALEIMKDSRIGTGGGVAIGLLLLTKWVLLVELLNLDLALWLLLIPFVARVGSMLLLVSTPFASPKGMAETMFRHVSRAWITAWALLAVMVLLLLQPWLLLLALVWFWLRSLQVRVLGGMNGDGAGMTTELLEVALILLLVVVAFI